MYMPGRLRTASSPFSTWIDPASYFFASSALYPLWRVREGSPWLYYVCELNPFTHAVELVRFALYGRINWISLAVVGGCTALFMVGAILAYDPSRGLLARRGEP